MELIKALEIKQTPMLKNFGGDGMVKMIMSVFKINEINKLYADNQNKPVYEFLESILNELGVTYSISNTDLEKIPKSGPFILLANHPYGGLDGIILLHALLKIRPDIKVMGNFLLKRVEPIQEHIISVNPFELKGVSKENITGFKTCIAHLKEEKPLAIFPAGEVSSYQPDSNTITDKKWQKSIIKFIQKAKVPVIPVYFQGTNSRMFHWLGFIHPVLRTAKIPSELLNKRQRTIHVRIGSPIETNEQDLFLNTLKLGQYLRAKIYALASSTNVNLFFKQFKTENNENIIPPIPLDLLCNDLEKLSGKYELFKHRNYSVFCAPSGYIPNIMLEIGRLREITFREVGEGTNNSMDLDEYDIYYWQLFIWDDENKAIVGGYRVGLGKEIMERFGKKGFYTRSLFRMDDKLNDLLSNSIELGRSFIVKEYQRKNMSLYLLWKGILLFLINNSEYRYLIGPVSITDRFSTFSKQLLVDFIQNHFFNHSLAKLIKPKKAFQTLYNKSETNILIEEVREFKQLELIICDIETSATRIPVLLKKYLQLGGKIAAFNVDPAFSNSLDGFLVLDLADVPKDIIQTLSRETNNQNIVSRFEFMG